MKPLPDSFDPTWGGFGKNGKAVPRRHTLGTSWQEVPREAENTFSNAHAAALKPSRKDASRAPSPALRVSIGDLEYARGDNVAIPLPSAGPSALAGGAA